MRIAVLVAVLAGVTMVAVSGLDMAFGRLSVVPLLGWPILLAFLIHSEHWRTLKVAAGLLASIVMLAVLGVPSWVRLTVSSHDIATAGREVLHGRSPGRAGLYGIVESHVEDGCAVLITQVVAINGTGIAYCPAGSAPSAPRFRHRTAQLFDYDDDL